MPNPFSSNIKALLRDGIKATSIRFGSGAGGAVASGNSYLNTGYNWGQGAHGRGVFSNHVGTAINWEAITGDLLKNPIGFTCLRIIQDNYCQADIQVERKGPDGKYSADPDHPLMKLFRKPNAFYSWDYLQKGVITSLHGQGDAYIGIEYDGNGEPAELYWLPTGVKPFRKPGSKAIVDYWIYTFNGVETKIPLQDIIHIPFGANPRRPGFGMSVDEVLKQSEYITQQGDNYTANIMRNNGALGGLITPKTIKDENGNVVEVSLDEVELTNAWRRKTRGDQVGDIMYVGYPVDVTFPNNTPENLSIGPILDRPENTIAAVMRVSILLVGAYGGREAKTYANAKEARESLYEDNLMPLSFVIDSECGKALIPLFGGDPEQERISHNWGEVRALQPDLDAKHKRVRDDFQANGIDLYTYEVETGRAADDRHKGVYAFMLPHYANTGQAATTLNAPGMKPEDEAAGPQAEEDSASPARAQAQLQPKPSGVQALLPPGAFGQPAKS